MKSDPKQQARPHVLRAADAVERGVPDDAIAELRVAAGIFADVNRNLDASHCLAQAGTIARLAGHLVQAIELLEDAVTLASDDAALARSALLELVDTSLLAMDHERALGYLELAESHMADSARELRVAVDMKAGEALLASGDEVAAEAAWRRALALSEGEHEQVALRLRRATLLVSAGAELAPGAVLATKAAAVKLDAPALRSDIAMLESALAVAEGDLRTAREGARLARKHAIEAGSEARALAAAVAEARISEQLG